MKPLATFFVFFVMSLTLPAARADTLADKIQRMESELEDLKQELREQKAAQQKADEQRAAEQKAAAEKAQAEHHQAESAAAEAQQLYHEVRDRVKIGGYGSTRFAASDLTEQKNTFTFRRLVLTADANIAPRLRSYLELEFEGDCHHQRTFTQR